MMFGFKKNRDPNPSINYELQVGTYALGIQNNPLSKGWDYALFLALYKKDNSTMKVVRISNDYITDADEYWKALQRDKKNCQNTILQEDLLHHKSQEY